jgi:chromosomal replication initiation ATPase DnaA
MCVNYREASQRGRSCPRRANAEAPLIEAIQQAVAEAFEVRVDDLCGRRPTLQINNYPEQVRKARKAAVYLCRELTEYDATRIAERFGRKSAVVKRSVESVRQVLDSDLDLASRLASAAQRLQAGLSRRAEDDVALFTEQLAQHHRHK